ncbi:hypothetical protein CR513_04869, partial [Mucuna pruriens]
MLVVVYNEACLNSKIDPSSLPISVISLLQDVQDVFSVEVPSGLPSIKGIEHHINLNPGATFLNKLVYRNRPASWEECLPHLQFAYNRTVQSTSYSPFEKIEFVRELHAKVQTNIKKRNRQYAKQANKGRVTVTFEPGDCVWVHRRKERFPIQQKYKLQQRRDETFQVLERINDNTYKLDLSTAYGEEFDSRTKPFEEGRNYRDLTNKAKDSLRDIGSSLTRPKTIMMKQSLHDVKK